MGSFPEILTMLLLLSKSIVVALNSSRILFIVAPFLPKITGITSEVVSIWTISDSKACILAATESFTSAILLLLPFINREIVGELDRSPGKDITQENIMHYATGAAEVQAV